MFAERFLFHIYIFVCCGTHCRGGFMSLWFCIVLAACICRPIPNGQNLIYCY